MPGQCIRNIDLQLISEEDTLLWLSRGYLKAETDSEVTAALYRTLKTKYHAMKILQTERVIKFRLCQKCDETIDYFTSAWPVLEKEQYIK